MPKFKSNNLVSTELEPVLENIQSQEINEIPTFTNFSSEINSRNISKMHTHNNSIEQRVFNTEIEDKSKNFQSSNLLDKGFYHNLNLQS